MNLRATRLPRAGSHAPIEGNCHFLQSVVVVHTVACNYNDNGELEALSGVNEAAALNADSDDIVNLLRNLFNAEM